MIESYFLGLTFFGTCLIWTTRMHGTGRHCGAYIRALEMPILPDKVLICEASRRETGVSVRPGANESGLGHQGFLRSRSLKHSAVDAETCQSRFTTAREYDAEDEPFGTSLMMCSIRPTMPQSCLAPDDIWSSCRARSASFLCQTDRRS